MDNGNEEENGTRWEKLDINEVFRRLDSREGGLSSDEAHNRRKQHPLTPFPQRKARVLPGRPKNYVPVGFANLLPHEAAILRDGRFTHLPEDDIVLGDVVTFRAGDKVCADVRILSCKPGTKVDCSAFDAEVREWEVQVDVVHDPLSAKTRMLLHGCLVLKGSATGIVVAIGGDTKLAGIITAADREERQVTEQAARNPHLDPRFAFTETATEDNVVQLSERFHIVSRSKVAAQTLGKVEAIVCAADLLCAREKQWPLGCVVSSTNLSEELALAEVLQRRGVSDGPLKEAYDHVVESIHARSNESAQEPLPEQYLRNGLPPLHDNACGTVDREQTLHVAVVDGYYPTEWYQDIISKDGSVEPLSVRTRASIFSRIRSLRVRGHRVDILAFATKSDEDGKDGDDHIRRRRLCIAGLAAYRCQLAPGTTELLSRVATERLKLVLNVPAHSVDALAHVLIEAETKHEMSKHVCEEVTGLLKERLTSPVADIVCGYHSIVSATSFEAFQQGTTPMETGLAMLRHSSLLIVTDMNPSKAVRAISASGIVTCLCANRVMAAPAIQWAHVSATNAPWSACADADHIAEGRDWVVDMANAVEFMRTQSPAAPCCSVS